MFSTYLGSCARGVGFATVEEEIINYSRRYGLSIPKYFVSMLKYMDGEKNLS